MASGSVRHALVLLVASLAFLLPCDPLIADRIFLNNGRELEGEITHQSEQSLTIRTDNGIVSVPAPSVTSVVREGAVQNRLNSLGRALLRGDLRQAVIALDGITSSADHRQEIDQLLLRHADAITDAVAGAPPSDVHMLTVHVRNRTGRTPDGILLLQARIAHAGGALLEAARQIQLVSPEFLRADTVARNRAVLILSDVLRRSMDTVEPEVAMELVVAFARLSQDTISTSTATAIYLSNASSRLQLGDYDGALQILRDHVLPMSPAIAATEIRTVLESAEKHTSESLFVDIQSRALDTLESAPLSGDLIPLWSRQVRALIRLGQLDEAASAALRLSLAEADEGARMGHLVELERRRAALSPDDSLERYRLGVWASEVGLYDEARGLLNSVREAPEVGKNAEIQLQLIQLSTERGEFDAVLRLYQEHKYDDAIRAAEEFRRRFPRSEFALKARELIEVAKYERTRTAEMRPAQADALYQNAERLYLQGRLAETVDIINRIETDYRDTEAAARASALRKKLGALARYQSRRTTQTATERAGALREQRIREIRSLSEEMTARRPDRPR